MKEQVVQYSEQSAGRQEADIASAIHAPMVERTFRLLELLSVTEEGLTLSDLGRALNMSKGSLHGLLKTLESNGAIEQAEERRFVLGPRIYDLAQTYIQRGGLRHFALPAMRRMASSTCETVCLGKVEQKGVRIIECIVDEGDKADKADKAALHISATRGLRVPLLAAATGPFVLANWSVAQREAFLYDNPLPRFTEHSITDPREFLTRVEEAARTGASFDHEEYLIGVNAVAAPIYGTGDTLVALLWVVGFASHFRDEALESAGQQLRTEAAMVSHALGASIAGINHT